MPKKIKNKKKLNFQRAVISYWVAAGMWILACFQRVKWNFTIDWCNVNWLICQNSTKVITVKT